MKLTVALVSLILAMAGTAHAQPSTTAPQPLSPQPAQPSPDDDLSENTAVLLSLSGTFASWMLVGVAAGTGSTTLGTVGALGTLVGPSFGHWYARKPVTRGLGIRLAGAGLTALGIKALLTLCEDECNATLPAAIALAGVGLYVVGTFDDFATASRDVRRYNQELHNISIVPMVRRDNNSLGLAITGRF